ncbi:histone-lysine N-methyltransferase NSD2-like isoform X2 [Mya arenaria]|uniref:histone-lysine N-methyltransferase NSD2-like isoform X2 n=1 Tax=Mya arenaria TaxID=6604 RepID=UPI0022DFC6CE|nr:histone-lysine N-methyltransferase NSD2-like isoform X2 [Mya arenaria]
MTTKAPETTVNGPGIPAPGFRHSLPQIASVSRPTKIAQSKAAAKPDVAQAEHSTSDVEGVGKVVHIGSEVMDDSPEKQLLDALDDSAAAADAQEKMDTDDAQESKDTTTEEPLKDKSTTADDDKSKVEKSKENAEGKEDKPDTKEESVVIKTTPAKEKKQKGRKRKTQSPKKSPVGTVKPKTAASPKKAKVADNTSIIPAEDVNSSGDLESPKRQRKPKKFEDDLEAETPTKPVIEKPVKMKATPVVKADPELEAKYPVKWMVGDMVWAKVSSHPWWPCMVSYDPFTAVSTRISARRSREYHVQFFGDSAERGWIASGNLLEFKGREEFDTYVQDLYSKAKNNKDLHRLKKWYGVPSNRKKALDRGIEHAEQALPLNVEDRKAQYTFTYQIPKSKKDTHLKEISEDVKIIKEAGKTDQTKPAKKRKHDEVATPEKGKSASKKQKLDSEYGTAQVDSPVKGKSSGKRTSVQKLKLETEGSFEVFCQKEKENVLAEHPEFTDDMLLDYCRQQWCMMSKKQKCRYKSKYSDDNADTGDDMSSPGRRRRPSKKVIEAEEDNKAVEEVLSDKKPSSSPARSKPTKEDTPSRKAKASDKKQEVPVKKKGRPRKSEPAVEAPVLQASPVPEKVKPKVKLESKPAPVTGEEEGVAGEGPGVSVEAGNKESEKETDVKPSVIPAKRAKPKKSLTAESSSNGETDSGRSTPTIQPEPLRPIKRDEYEYEMEIFKLSSVGSQKKENLCQICEQTGELLECDGPCQGFFHCDCLGITKPTDGKFLCDECTNGVHTCFVCKKADQDTQRCSVAVCGKFYHSECLKEYPQTKIEGKGLTCPLHLCHTCFANNLKGTAAKSNGRLLRCVRCPTAYHVGDFCIAAGSINLTGFNIVCAKHFQPVASMKHHTHVNVGWCFSCNKGGTLLCCESCPAAYHAECLNIDFPTGSWYCNDCARGKRPLYGDIIWVKLGNYRWWPGEICHPRNVPLNIQEKAHQVGEFSVHFLGSHEYFWLHQGRVFSFQDGDKGTGGSSSNKGLAKHFIKGLKEATEGFKAVKDFRENREQLELAKESKKPAAFKMVKNNIPLGSVTIKKADLSELPRCDCKPDQENPCGRDSECLNGMMMYECHPALCPAGENCHNQFFTKRLYPPQQPYKTEGRGWGLKAMADIKKGAFVNEYVGDLVDEEECKRRLEKAHETGIHNFYMMTLDMDRIIDAGPKGNMSRFMNHSCDPNLETQKWYVNGDIRVGLFALRDIKEGEELTFNYNFDCLGNEQTKCQCGAENCSGYLGVRPKTQSAQLAEMKRKEAKHTKLKKKKKLLIKRKHDDDCFRCGEGGELVMCDRTSCPKSYHLRCLGLSKPPYGKWDCPWHHCDDCGKPAVSKCVECPNSYCQTHTEEQTQEFEGRIYCTEHEDLLDTLMESQSQTSAPSDDESVQDGEKSEKPTGKKDVSKNGKSKNGEKVKKDNGEVKEKKTKAETLPPKKRAKLQAESIMGKNENGDEKPASGGNNGEKVTSVGGKATKARRGSAKGEGGRKSSGLEETLAVAPMFDDDEEEEFGLVIDIPNF